jgi:hypothetical protein
MLTKHRSSSSVHSLKRTENPWGKKMSEELLKKFDAFEVHPVCEVNPHFTGEVKRTYEICDPEDAETWSVYGHLIKGGIDCLCDCPTKEIAEVIYTVLESTLRQTVQIGHVDDVERDDEKNDDKWETIAMGLDELIDVLNDADDDGIELKSDRRFTGHNLYNYFFRVKERR